jgi:ABC-type dipeptide/oligopeptide/nickel transport system permease subunit
MRIILKASIPAKKMKTEMVMMTGMMMFLPMILLSMILTIMMKMMRLITLVMVTTRVIKIAFYVRLKIQQVRS